jgi:hypothetical protein
VLGGGGLGGRPEWFRESHGVFLLDLGENLSEKEEAMGPIVLYTRVDVSVPK